MEYEWDPDKAQRNREKHGIRFADAVTVLEDPFAITIPDDHTDEERLVTIGEDAFGQLLVVVYTGSSGIAVGTGLSSTPRAEATVAVQVE